VGGKTKLLALFLVLAAAGGGAYYWMSRSSSNAPATVSQAPVAPRRAAPGRLPPEKPKVAHPLPGETVNREQPFMETNYGFSMVLPAGWKVVNWTDPVPPEQGKRRPTYKIRLEDPRSGRLLDFAVYPFTEKSRYAVEEIFISKIDPPVPGLQLDIQLDEVLKEGEMRIRRAEMKTLDATGAAGLMKTYYYLAGDKLYTFSLLGSEGTFTAQGSGASKILEDIRILG
jgi:hypothetical protein